MFSPAGQPYGYASNSRHGLDDFSLKPEAVADKRPEVTMRKPSPLMPWGCISPTDPTEKARYEASRAGVGVKNEQDPSNVVMVPFNAVTGESYESGKATGYSGYKRSNPTDDGNPAQRLRVPNF